jgi:hypothetical protein
VEDLGEQEGDPDLPRDPLDRGDRKVQADPESFEAVRTARAGARGTVAVLDHTATGGGDHHGRHRRDVDGLGEVTAGADDVDGILRDLEGSGVGDHRVGQALQFRTGDPLAGEGHQESGELDGGDIPLHHLAHRPSGLRRGEVLPSDQTGGEDRPRG